MADATLAPGRLNARGPVSLALWVSGFRCVMMYVFLPALAPVIGLTTAVALPLILGLHALSLGAAGLAWWRSVTAERWAGALLAAFLVVLNIVSVMVM